MNWRRIGSAAALAALGAVVRRRMSTQADPGPTVDPSVTTKMEGLLPEGLSAPVPSDEAGIAPVDRAPLEVALSEEQEIEEQKIEVPQLDLAGASERSNPDPAPEAPSADQLAGTIADLADTRPSPMGATHSAELKVGQLAVAGIAIPSAETSGERSISGDSAAERVVLDEPSLPARPIAPVVENDPGREPVPAIVIPSMPAAGTNTVINPVVESINETVKPVSGAGVESTTKSSLPLDAPTQVSAVTGSEFTGVGNSLMLPDPTETSTAAAPPFSGDTASSEDRRKSFGFWTILGGVFSVLLLAALLAATFVRLPYYRLDPGSVYDTIERVEAPTDLVSIPEGEIGFVTVSQRGNINGWQWLDAKLDSNVRIRHEDEVRGDQTADELREADLRRMQVSKNSAVVVALRKLGFDLVVTPIGVEVSAVFDCTAADGTLGTGDLIVGVNGVDVRDGETLVAELMGIGIGQDVELLVERIDPTNPTQSMRTDLVGLTLGSADADCLADDVRAENPRPFIGIGTLTIVEEDFPIEVDIRTGSVTGPSAGLAFTLAIMDVLSEGELTNGLNIVATGSIDRDGNIGPVGGIHQKTVAAERDGADVFIVPLCCDNFVDRDTGEAVDLPSNYEEALLHADEMTVIGVNTIDEALVAIAELGGDVSPFVVE